MVERRVNGTCSVIVSVERRRRRAGASAVSCRLVLIFSLPSYVYRILTSFLDRKANTVLEK